jgi:hypothetical protein
MTPAELAAGRGVVERVIDDELARLAPRVAPEMMAGAVARAVDGVARVAAAVDGFLSEGAEVIRRFEEAPTAEAAIEVLAHFAAVSHLARASLVRNVETLRPLVASAMRVAGVDGPKVGHA